MFARLFGMLFGRIMIASLMMSRCGEVMFGGFVMTFGRVHMMFRSRVLHRHIASPKG